MEAAEGRKSLTRFRALQLSGSQQQHTIQIELQPEQL
jgi:hypothetical protein